MTRPRTPGGVSPPSRAFLFLGDRTGRALLATLANGQPDTPRWACPDCAVSTTGQPSGRMNRRRRRHWRSFGGSRARRQALPTGPHRPPDRRRTGHELRPGRRSSPQGGCGDALRRSSADVSTQEIIGLREQGLTWPEIGQRVGMSAPGVASRFRRATLKRIDWVSGAVVFSQAPADGKCVRCDEAIRAGDRAASVPGLNDRGWAHADCLIRRSTIRMGFGTLRFRADTRPSAL